MLMAYIAAPLFTEAERFFNERLSDRLGAVVDCYLPQRDGVLLSRAVWEGADRSQTSREIFSSDIAAIRRSDFVIAVLDGVEIDAGVAVEIGVSWALGKRVFGLRTDSRRPICGGLNPMIEGACSCVVDNVDQLVRLLSEKAASQ